ncbi:polyunsaturated fatty acid 5-lipoxygenase-like [Tubulanus polymorphus]|uniref:polyunsaturated fatty acid 5-lipoxygenase-like n=1 Tax=Tubulanus polymorphus TaxID=672921 RepID=UPI003DA2E992
MSWLDNPLWRNRYEEVFQKATGGEGEYNTKLKKQDDMLKASSSSNCLGMLDKINLSTKKAKLKMYIDKNEKTAGPKPDIGVGAAGYATVLQSVKDIPENTFFTPGRCFQARIRHFNFPESDDRAPSFRGLVLKLTDKHTGGPLDMMFITGPQCAHPTIAVLDSYLHAIKAGPQQLKTHLLQYPVLLEAYIGGVRKNLISYADQFYYNQCVYFMRGSDNADYMVRFRVIPADTTEESGLLSDEDQMHVWDLKVDDDNRTADYLKNEYYDRVKTGPVYYLLQMQWRPAMNDIGPEVTSGALKWDAEKFHYYNLMVVNIDCTVPLDSLNATKWDLTKIPPILKQPTPKGLGDFALVPLTIHEIDMYMTDVPNHMKKQSKNEAKNDTGINVQYTINVQTGNLGGAGTDGNVRITLIGKLGRTSRHNLDTDRHDDFEAGQLDSYKFEDREIGEFLMAQIDLDVRTGREDWYLEHVEIFIKSDGSDDRRIFLPCNHWLTKEFPSYQLKEINALPLSKQRDYIIQHWREDIEFGRQIMNANAPNLIYRLTEIPENFPIDRELLDALLKRDISLEAEIQDGNMYMVNLDGLAGIKCYRSQNERRFICHPMCLLYVRPDGTLVPIAIQLFQRPGDKVPIWTPKDDPLDWLYAKIWFKCAFAQYSTMYVHLLMTHLVTEAVCIASLRTMPSCHPVHALLQPHMKYTVAINTLGKQIWWPGDHIVDKTHSIGGGGQLDFMGQMYRNFNMGQLNIPEDMKRRGVDDKEKLPGYHYRDDSLLLWDTILTYVTEYIKLYYKYDYDVGRDVEFHNFLRDLKENGFYHWENDEDHGVPEKITTIKGLSVFLTGIIFNATCQHAAVNFSSLDMLAFQPNCPTALGKPPPTKKGLRLPEVMDALPNKEIASHVTCMANALTQFADKEEYLGLYPNCFYEEERLHKVVIDFQEKLKGVSEAIRKRNEDLACPYEYLLPERVPNYTGI